MLKKCIYMLVLCLISSFAIAEDKKEMKDFMQEYAKAYNSMDNKKLLEFVTPEYLNKLKWEFHDFRKMHQKPRLKLFEIVTNKDKVNCVASLELNNKVKYRNTRFIFTIKNGKIQVRELYIEPVKNIRKIPAVNNFWAAIKIADGFAVVEAKKKKSFKIIKILPTEFGKSSIDIKLPVWLKSSMIEDGKYIVPLIAVEKKIQIIGNRYRLPAYKEKNIGKFLEDWQNFKNSGQAGENNILKRIIIESSDSKLVVAALNRLLTSNYFNKKLSKEDITMWSDMILKSKISSRNKATVIGLLAKYNYKAFKPALNKALQNPKMTKIAAYQLLSHDEAELKTTLNEWLKNDKLRIFALKNASLMLKDKNFIRQATNYYKNVESDKARLFLPILILPDNKKGNAIVRKILNSDQNEYKKLIPTIYIMILVHGYPEWNNEVRKVLAMKNNKHINFMEPLAIAYLCKNNAKEGKEIAQRYLKKISNDNVRQKRYMRAFSSVYKKHINSIEELKKYINNNR